MDTTASNIFFCIIVTEVHSSMNHLYAKINMCKKKYATVCSYIMCPIQPGFIF